MRKVLLIAAAMGLFSGCAVHPNFQDEPFTYRAYIDSDSVTTFNACIQWIKGSDRTLEASDRENGVIRYSLPYVISDDRKALIQAIGGVRISNSEQKGQFSIDAVGAKRTRIGLSQKSVIYNMAGGIEMMRYLADSTSFRQIFGQIDSIANRIESAKGVK